MPYSLTIRNIIYLLAYRPLYVKTSEVKSSVYYILTKGLIFIVLMVYHCFDLLTFMHGVGITILLIF
jgi:hypothetical protein